MLQPQGDEPLDKRTDDIIADLRAVPRPRLIIISGPSGVGKDTVIDQMRALYPEMHFAVTATTRKRRGGEIDGIHYHFFSREEFAQKLVAGEFLESAEVYGFYYGVPRTPIRLALARGQDVVLKVDTQGAQTIRQIVPHGIYIFIAPPSIDELARRLRSRKTDDNDALMRRLRTAQRELATVESFDYVVFNESEQEEATVAQIIAILTAERLRLHQNEVEL
jgi:guanylate kinase